MCWRDDVRSNRVCIVCGSSYYGDLGHRGCPGWKTEAKPVEDGNDPKKAKPEKKEAVDEDLPF